MKSWWWYGNGDRGDDDADDYYDSGDGDHVGAHDDGVMIVTIVLVMVRTVWCGHLNFQSAVTAWNDEFKGCFHSSYFTRQD